MIKDMPTQVQSAEYSIELIKKKILSAEEQATVRKLRNWKAFHNCPRKQGINLLQRLSDYRRPILVAGCQRSGTTILTRIIAGSKGFARLSITEDDELDAALALSGKIKLPTQFRYCFQTTYLNERFHEYRALGGAPKLIWVVRNPQSVVHSMLYNWKRFALNELFASCGIEKIDRRQRATAYMPIPFGVSKLDKACYSYVAKSEQLLEIRNWIASDNLFVVDYDALVTAPSEWLPAIFKFINEPYEDAYALSLNRGSQNNSKKLSDYQRKVIHEIAYSTYSRCLQEVSYPFGLRERVSSSSC